MRPLLLGVGGFILVVAVAFSADARSLEAPPVQAEQPAALAADTSGGRAHPGAPERVTATATPSPPLTPRASAPAPTSRGVPPPATSARAIVLLDDASGAVLFQRDAHTPLAPASLTKIATAIVALEHGGLDAMVDTGEVDSRSMPRDSTVMGVLPGDRFSLRDLLYGLMLPSGNDAAIVIGRYVAGSDPAFVDAMNELASRLGLRDTHFANAHGLAAIAHYSSAYDLAMLSRYAMTLPEYRAIASADQWTAHGSRDLTVYSLITDVRWRIPGVDAGKSGFTDASGRTLALSVERDGHRLHAVLLNDKYTEGDAVALIDWAFANFEWAPAVASPQATPPPTATPDTASSEAGDSRIEALYANE